MASIRYEVYLDKYTQEEIDSGNLENREGVLVYNKTTMAANINTGSQFQNVASAGLGWADYSDTEYTEASAFTLTADTATRLPNNGLAGPKTYTPADLNGRGFYDASGDASGGLILGLEGESLVITLDFKAKPSSVAATYIDQWFDIGGGVGELYRRTATFPKGSGVERNITFTTAVYTLDTWEANGAQIWVESNGPVEIYDIRFVIFRLFKPGT